MAITVTRRTRRARSKTTGVEGGTIVGGNLLRDSLNRTYAFDAENLMTALCSSQTNPAQCTNAWTNGNVAYSYDGDGRRVQTAEANGTVTTYVYDAGGQLAAEYGGSPIPICKQSSPATPGACYSVADRLGSTRVVTTDRGIPLECDDYLPFGAEVPSSIDGRSGCYQANLDRLQFTGKERDAETGLDYFLARYYSSAQGRFTSPDESKGGGLFDPLTGLSAETIGPLPYADISDPQTLNKYAYVRNNPLRYVDPTGHCIWDPCIGEGSAAYAIGGAAIATAAYLASPQGQKAVASTVEGLGLLINKAVDGLASLLPGTPSQAPDINAGQIQKGVQPYDVGTAGDLRGNSLPGDQVDIHHVPQQQPAGQVISGYDPKTAPAIAVPEGEHRTIPRDTGAATRSPRDQLAKDVKDLRNNTNAPNGQVQKLIDLSKQKYPEMRKPNDQ